MRRAFTALAILGTVVVGCSGSSIEVQPAASLDAVEIQSPESAGPTIDAAPTAVATKDPVGSAVEAGTPTATVDPNAPEDVAFAQTDVVIDGATAAIVVPGETVHIDHLVHNASRANRMIAIQATPGPDTPRVLTSINTVRLDPGEVTYLQSTITIDENAQVGDVLSYVLLAVNRDDIGQRDTTTVELTVGDPVGQRPELGPNIGRTDTNERATLFVVADDSDPDGDLDLKTMSVVAGGFLASSVSASNGSVIYDPFVNVTGTDIVLYQICDKEGLCATAPVTIGVSVDPES